MKQLQIKFKYIHKEYIFLCYNIYGDNMKESLKTYIEYLESIPKKELKNNEPLKEELLTQIQIFQHERLIHLIVTVFVGIVSIIIFSLSLIINNLFLNILLILLILLFIPYIFHYYFLENNVQKLYSYYWDINKK